MFKVKIHRWVVFSALALFLNVLPALGGACPGEFKPADFPSALPGLGEEACPTSEDIGFGLRLIQQDFEMKGVPMQLFIEGYSAALIEKGWQEPKVTAMGPVTSLNSAHPDGFNLQLVLNDLNMTALHAPKVAPPPLTRAKVILQKSP